jgi:hypothetical protein
MAEHCARGRKRRVARSDINATETATFLVAAWEGWVVLPWNQRGSSQNAMTMRTELLRFNGAVERDPAIDPWMKEHAGELGAIAHQWFEVMRKCGDEVRELLHDGCPVACLEMRPSATSMHSLRT